LVGLGADIAGGDAVHGAVELVRIGNRQPAHHVAHARVQPAGKGAATAQLVFVDAALAFVDAHRDAAAQRREGVVLVDALFVAGMPDLVDGRVDAVEGVGLDDAGGDAAVLPATAGKRVHGDIHPPAGPVIAEAGGAGP